MKNPVLTPQARSARTRMLQRRSKMAAHLLERAERLFDHFAKNTGIGQMNIWLAEDWKKDAAEWRADTSTE